MPFAEMKAVPFLEKERSFCLSQPSFTNLPLIAENNFFHIQMKKQNLYFRSIEEKKTKFRQKFFGTSVLLQFVHLRNLNNFNIVSILFLLSCNCFLDKFVVRIQHGTSITSAFVSCCDK